MDPHGPEVSDLIIDYDPDSHARRPVDKRAVLDTLRRRGLPARARRIAEALPAIDGVLDPAHVDGVLVRSHLELQRLHEEFRVGETMRQLLAPMLELVRAKTAERPVRIVDLGCGMGYITRWLAAHGGLGDDVALVGVDYNLALLGAARRLAEEDGLPCRFLADNAFRLDQPAHLVISTGVLHHFRGPDLARVFVEHERSGALAFVHLDIRPSWLAPIGAYIFHQARMREPLARFDGYWSAVRAHDAAALRGAIAEGAPSFSRALVDARPGLYALVRVFQAALGARATPDELARACAVLGRRVDPA